MSRNINEIKMLEMLKEKPEGVYQHEIIEKLNVHRDTVNNLYKKLIAKENEIEKETIDGKRVYRLKGSYKIKETFINHFSVDDYVDTFFTKLDIIENIKNDSIKNNETFLLDDCIKFIWYNDVIKEKPETYSYQTIQEFFPKYSRDIREKIIDMIKRAFRKPENKIKVEKNIKLTINDQNLSKDEYKQEFEYYEWELREFIKEILNEIIHNVKFDFAFNNQSFMSNENLNNFSSMILNYFLKQYFTNPETILLSDEFEKLEFNINISFKVSDLFKKYFNLEDKDYWKNYKGIINDIKENLEKELSIRIGEDIELFKKFKKSNEYIKDLKIKLGEDYQFRQDLNSKIKDFMEYIEKHESIEKKFNERKMLYDLLEGLEEPFLFQDKDTFKQKIDELEEFLKS